MRWKSFMEQPKKAQLLSDLLGRELKPYEQDLNSERWSEAALQALTKEELVDHFVIEHELLMISEQTISDILFYSDHLADLKLVEQGEVPPDLERWAGTLAYAEAVRELYGEDLLRSLNDAETKELETKLSMIRWLLGKE